MGRPYHHVLMIGIGQFDCMKRPPPPVGEGCWLLRSSVLVVRARQPIFTASGVIVLLGPRHRTALVVSHHDDAKAADAAGGPREHPTSSPGIDAIIIH